MSTPVFFIQGLQPNDTPTVHTGFDTTAAAIQKAIQAQCPGVGLITFLHYDGDPTSPAGTPSCHDIIAAACPSGPFILGAWSYGGGCAVLVAYQFAADNPPRAIPYLILHDPVPETQGSNPAVDAPPAVVGSPAQFQLPSNVGQCVCFPRDATIMPWSCPIIAIAGKWQNLVEPGGPNSGAAVNHGYSLWASQCIAYYGIALAGGQFFGAPPMPLQVTPQSPTVDVGASVTFIVPAAAGGSSYNWQLYQNGTWGSAGVFTPSYTIGSVSAAQNGLLVGCNVTSGGQVTNAGYATLTVTAPPPATKFLVSVETTSNPKTGGLSAQLMWSDGSSTIAG
jgi:hypothetical protein